MSIDLGLAHLRAVVAVADTGGFSAAGRRLGVAQSSLSRTVMEAERRLRTPLFVRTSRSVRLTRDGEEVVAVARALVAQMDAGLAHVEGYLAGARGRLTVAALPSLAATVLPVAMREYRRRHPDVVVSVEDGLSEGVLGQLTGGDADVAVAAVAGRLPEGVEAHPLATDAFFLAAPRDHRLARRRSVRWTDLEGESVISFGAASSIRGVVDRALATHDVHPGTVTQAQNVAAVAGLAAGGLGVAAVPGLVLPLIAFADLAVVPLVPTVTRHVALLRVRDRPVSPAVRAWTDLLTGGGIAWPAGLTGVTWAPPTRVRAGRAR